jgi:hypothetical protein
LTLPTNVGAGPRRRRLAVGALSLVGTIVATVAPAAAPPEPVPAPSVSPAPEVTCFVAEQPVFAINDEGVWTSKGQVFDAEGRRRLTELKPSKHGELESIGFDRDLIVAAGGPDPDGSLTYWIDAFSKDGHRLWQQDLELPEALEDAPISVAVAIPSRSPTVSVLVYGEACGSRGCVGAPRQGRQGATYLVELISYSRDGKLLARRKLTNASVDRAAFSPAGELAISGTADRRLELHSPAGTRRLVSPAGAAFVERYDQEGHPRWSRAFSGAKKLWADVRFDGTGTLWTALFGCGSGSAETVSVLGAADSGAKLALPPFCTQHLAVDDSGSVRATTVAPCATRPSGACPKPNERHLLPSAGFALLGEGGRVFALGETAPPDRQVIDLRPKDSDGRSYFLSPLAEAGPVIRMAAPPSAAGVVAGRLCLAVRTAKANIRCDRWVETSRSQDMVVACVSLRSTNPSTTNRRGVP